MHTADGMQCLRDGDLFYRCWLPERVQNARAVLVFLHGAGEHSGYYADLAPVCRQHEFAYIAPDLRGFGRSGGRRGHVHCFGDYLRDVHRLVRRVRQRFPEQPVFLAGHSLGALVVIRYVQQFDTDIRGSIVSAPAFGVPFRFSSRLVKLLEWAAKMAPVLSVNAAWLAKYVKVPWLRSAVPHPEVVLRDPLVTCHYTAAWLTEMLRNGAEALADALRFSVPTFCIYFERDPVVNVAFIRQFYETIQTDEKACIVLPDADHNLWHHPEKPRIVRQMMQWMAAMAP